jgi:hypothetical protein
LLCKEENGRAGRIIAAGKMKETVDVLVHKEAMKVMDRIRITVDRVDNKPIMDTANKTTGTDIRAIMASKEDMAIMTRAITDSAGITDTSKAATGDSMKDMAACRAALAAMEMKGNMVSRAGMAISKVVTEDTATRAAGVAIRAAMVECRVAMVDMVNREDTVNMATNMATGTDREMKMMMTIITMDACRDAIAVVKMKI